MYNSFRGWRGLAQRKEFMNSKHTPGPWTLHSHMGEHFITGGNPSFLIAHASNGRTHHEPDESNARLIASAPDLLEALTLARKHLDWSLDGNDFRTIAGKIDKALAAAGVVL